MIKNGIFKKQKPKNLCKKKKKKPNSYILEKKKKTNNPVLVFNRLCT